MSSRLFKVPRWWIWSFGIVAGGLFVLVAVAYSYVSYQQVHNVWWRSEKEITAYLLAQTPLGSTEAEVITWLERHDVSAPYMARFVRRVEPYEFKRDGFFDAKASATAQIHEGLAEYGYPFLTTVEGFYLFDEGRLVDIGVRKTAEGL